ncbi:MULTISPECIES: hypothetical protein [Streptomyces]|uniref:ATP-binding protein n=1 Tax=Streptomyces ramulosus TaxID=47762 RepID=A0ABW1FEW2_9ACTN
MFRRLTVLLAALCTAGALAAGPAIAAPADDHDTPKGNAGPAVAAPAGDQDTPKGNETPADDHDLTPKEKAGLDVVGKLLGGLLGLGSLGGGAL